MLTARGKRVMHAMRLPRKWIERALASAATIPDFFSTHRMVSEYTTRAYIN